MKRIVNSLLLASIALSAVGQTEWAGKDIVKPRIRVIVDNDFGSDPDGLFHLALASLL